MEMGFFKLQLGCMLIVLYIAGVYYKERVRFKQKIKWGLYDGLLFVSILAVFFDGATAYTVNHLETVDATLNLMLHLSFLLCLDLFVFLLFLYMLSMTAGFPKSRKMQILLYTPVLLNVILVIFYIPALKYYEGELSNYSMGVSAYTCFIMVGVYLLLSFVTFFGRWRFMEKHKRIGIFTYLFILICVTVYQMIHPQFLISSIGVTAIVLGIYINQENPSVAELDNYQKEMIMGFATLVENKDGSTGGHIKRTTIYVRLLAEELRDRGYFKDVLTKDYIQNLCQAAPMHDIGKIAVPDAVLQKPGKLTEEEFEIIKKHTESGGKIIQKTFGHLPNEQYTQMAYEVARFHHEKWNGKGYPEGRKKREIPLCARIMAIADVFDAVSERRCYRAAMPLEKCFSIIREGSGQDFDPMLVEVFMDIRDKVEKVHSSIQDDTEAKVWEKQEE